MAVFMLETLVLRGVVRSGELAVVDNHGTGTMANPRTPPGHPTCLPLPGSYRPEHQVGDPDEGTTSSGTLPRTGRSCSSLLGWSQARIAALA